MLPTRPTLPARSMGWTDCQEGLSLGEPPFSSGTRTPAAAVTPSDS